MRQREDPVCDNRLPNRTRRSLTACFDFSNRRDDPSIIVRSIATQIKTLLSDPCNGHPKRAPSTIVIDGLDECEGESIQIEILRAIGESTFNHFNPFRFIIASRPEPHIREMFDSPVYAGQCRSLNVEKSFDDVCKYLCDEFSRNHREHRTMANIPLPWPLPYVLDDLVRSSSGHFIYAATIIKFIDDRNYRSTQRLAVLQSGTEAGTRSAFDALDQLYMTVLEASPRQAELVPILCAIANFDLRVVDIDELLELTDGDAHLLLQGLHSVFLVSHMYPYTISSHHASFLDFLNNHRRSQRWFGASDASGPLFSRVMQ
ncbi:hypothetical protein C8R45DRAFT_818109 [Mycena sanguinolenta]|nr:hypothetical protein C8R45DRAFT_818109 [Mycena sanguinolenta]